MKSKPGRGLTPRLKAACDAIYDTNPERYKDLIVWVWRMQKYRASDESIAEALEMAGPNIMWADDWWEYLTSIMPKASAKVSEKENKGYKKDFQAVGTILERIAEGIKK